MLKLRPSNKLNRRLKSFRDRENQETATRAIDAKAESDRSLAAERLNKVGLDAALSAERISRAEEERTAGALNIVKILHELDGINIENLRAKLAFIKELEGKETDNKSQNPSEVVKKAESA